MIYSSVCVVDIFNLKLMIGFQILIFLLFLKNFLCVQVHLDGYGNLRQVDLTLPSLIDWVVFRFISRLRNSLATSLNFFTIENLSSSPLENRLASIAASWHNFRRQIEINIGEDWFESPIARCLEAIGSRLRHLSNFLPLVGHCVARFLHQRSWCVELVIVNFWLKMKTIVKRAARTVRYVVLALGGDLAVQSIAWVLCRLQVHASFTTEASNPRLACLIMTKLLSLFPVIILDKSAPASFVMAQVHWLLGWLVKGAQAVILGRDVIILTLD